PSATLLFCITPPPPSSTLFPYTTLFRSSSDARSMHCKDHRKRLLSPYVFFRSALLLPGIRNNESYQKVHPSPLFLTGQLQLLLRQCPVGSVHIHVQVYLESPLLSQESRFGKDMAMHQILQGCQ